MCKKRSYRRKLIYLVHRVVLLPRREKIDDPVERIWVSSRRRFTRKLLSLGGTGSPSWKSRHGESHVFYRRKVKFGMSCRIARMPTPKFRHTAGEGQRLFADNIIAVSDPFRTRIHLLLERILQQRVYVTDVFTRRSGSFLFFFVCLFVFALFYL